MDSYISSASKAYSDGYYVTYGDSFISTVYFSTVTVDMVGQVPKLALMVSKPLLAIVGSFVTAAEFLLFYLLTTHFCLGTFLEFLKNLLGFFNGNEIFLNISSDLLVMHDTAHISACQVPPVTCDQ